MARRRIRDALHDRDETGDAWRCDACRATHVDYCQPCQVCYDADQTVRAVYCPLCMPGHVRDAHPEMAPPPTAG